MAFVLFLLVWLFAGATEARAQDGSNVLLVLNSASAAGEELGARYAKGRQVPEGNVLRLTVSTAEEIERSQFERDIERPIANWINRNAAQDRLLYIVLVKGIPIRVRGTNGTTGTVASVDSELSLLYRKLLGISIAAPGRVANPYFNGTRPIAEAQPFSHALSDIYLVTRLDGYTPADVQGLIDRGATRNTEGTFLLDQRAQLLGEQSGDSWLAAAAAQLKAAGLADRVRLDSSRTVVTGAKSLLGYYSWGSNDSAMRTRRLELGFSPGALAAMFVSTDARTFTEPPETWDLGTWSDAKTQFAGSPQSLIGDLIRAGVTGVAGHVAEPYLDAAVKPQVLFPAYVKGLNLAEAYYLAIPYLSWQSVVVGDPLCGPFRSSSLPTQESAPELDAETEFPKYFSARRLKLMTSTGMSEATAKLTLKGDARLAKGDRVGAESAFAGAIAIDPKLTVVQLTLANLYEASQEYDKAIERYRAVLANSPNEFLSLNNLAYALAVHKGAPAEALPLAERAYALSRNPQVADTVGWIHYILGDLVESERYLGEAVKGAPMNATVRLHMAQLYAGMGQQERAAEELKIAVELEPNLEQRQEVTKLRVLLAKPTDWRPTPR